MEFHLDGATVLIDVGVTYDVPENFEAGFKRKVAKYNNLSLFFPFVVGWLGSWYPRNDDIKSFLNIDPRTWNAFRRKCRVAAIEGSMVIVESHLAKYVPPPLAEQPAELVFDLSGIEDSADEATYY